VFGGSHGSVHQAEDHRCAGDDADGGGLGRAGPRLKLPIVNFRRPIGGLRTLETLRRFGRYFPGRRRSLGEGRARPPCWAAGGTATVAGRTGDG
jgi:hypothetical protein